MDDRPRFFDDIAGVAGGAFSALAGAREEVASMIRTRVDEALAGLSLVRREEFEVARDLAVRARESEEELRARLTVAEDRITALEQRTAGHEHHRDASDMPPHAG